MVLYQIEGAGLRRLDPSSFVTLGVLERNELQPLFRDRIDVLLPDAMVITEEFSDWEDSRRRIDLLALDRNANLVVVELKRTDDGGHMELQAVRYAAMVSEMTFEQVADIHARFLARRGDSGNARERVLEFLGWEDIDEGRFGQDVRIVLASAEFSKKLTTAVMWLNERGLDIRCVRVQPYEDSGRMLLDVQQVLPLPEAEEYQVRLREKASRERSARMERNERNDQQLRFWTQLLAKASTLTKLHAHVSPLAQNWISTSSRNLFFNYVFGRECPRVEFYMGRSAEENLSILRSLEERKDKIEREFGGPLSWQPLDGKIACRIAAPVDAGSLDDETTWSTLQERMIDAMVRLERALRPHLIAYRYGE
ncbi:MAG: DUF4268 domain-containing protein [Planctomycetes bacterium]|nr:DUF4268 domain-containing protein [Planctomycetota bacterium]